MLNPDLPTCNQAEHLYGFRGHDCRNNLMYTGNGKIVYMAAAICVVRPPFLHPVTHPVICHNACPDFVESCHLSRDG